MNKWRRINKIALQVAIAIIKLGEKLTVVVMNIVSVDAAKAAAKANNSLAVRSVEDIFHIPVRH